MGIMEKRENNENSSPEIRKGKKVSKVNELSIFDNKEFGQLRTITINNEPWFVGKDVCEMFGDKNSNRTLSRLDDADKMTVTIETNGGPQNAIVINESGLYALLFAMQPQKANKEGIQDAYPLETQLRINKLHAFKHWVTHEVLPSIRKTGFYATPTTVNDILADPDSFIQVLQEYKKVRQENEALTTQVAVQSQQIAEMKPKVTYYDIVLQCKDPISITEIAKDYGKSGQWMNGYLREKKIQYKIRKQKTWLLYQKYADKGYTKSVTALVPDRYGEMHSRLHTYWTQAGRLFIYDTLKADGILPIVERTGTYVEDDECEEDCPF